MSMSVREHVDGDFSVVVHNMADHVEILSKYMMGN